MVVWNWLVANSSVIFAALFFLSEALSLIPSVKANGVFQQVYKWLADKEAPKP